MTIDETQRRFRLIICHFLKVNNLADIKELVPTLDKWIKGGIEEWVFYYMFSTDDQREGFLFAAFRVRSLPQRGFIVA